MTIGFDVISDLRLDPDEEFMWEDKVTSLFLIIAGNVSNDMRKLQQTLTHLSTLYQGVFYIPGFMEYDSLHFLKHRTNEIRAMCKKIKNVALLEKHVVIINNVAIIGVNGWYGNEVKSDEIEQLYQRAQNADDVEYLKSGIERLQLHMDINKIIIVSNSVPGPKLYFGEEPPSISEGCPLQECISADTEHKITKWLFGNYNKQVDTTIESIHYVSNCPTITSPYWAKRIEV